MPYSSCTFQYPITLHTNYSILTLLHSTAVSSSQSYLLNHVSFSFGPGLTVRSHYGYHVYVYVMWYDGWSIRCPSASGKRVYLRLDCVCVAPRVKLSVGKSLHAIHQCTFAHFWKCGGWSIRCPSASGKRVYLRLDCVCVAPRVKLSVVPTSIANISSPAQKIWNYNRADWALFRENVNFSVDLSDVSDIDKVISDFNNNILNAANIAIPEKKLPVNRLPVPWWDDEVKTVIAERRKCLRALRRNPSDANRIAFMRARAVARKMLKTKKRKSWSDFVGSIDHSMSSGEVFHKMGKLRSKYSPRSISAIQDRNNPSLLLYDSQSIANTLGAQFASVSSDANYSADFLSFKAASESSPIDFDYSKTDEFNCPFSYKEMMNSLLSCGSKAAGPDGISFLMLKQRMCSEEGAEAMSRTMEF
ncbi:hypothetical protein M8J76_013272 [Diaphorina citri]|nr:hypothetical protein M8J76_013272 [Diaphorina citri]